MCRFSSIPGGPPPPPPPPPPPDWQPQVAEAREVGSRILLRVRAEGAGTGSGIGLDRDIWQVVQVRDGLLRSWMFARTEQEALTAAITELGDSG